MKTLNLKFLFLLPVCLFFITLSCNEDDPMRDIYTEPTVAKFNLEKLNSFFNNLNPKESDITALTARGGNDFFYAHMFEFTNNFNNLFEDPENLELLSISYYHNDNEINGIVAYIYSVVEQQFFINVYSLINDELVLKDGYPKIMNDVLYEDLVFVKEKFFEGSDITAITVNDYSRHLTYDYNDLYISHMTSDIKNGSWFDENYESDAMASSCSAAVHHCRTGSGSRCGAYGCTSTCTHDEFDEELERNNSSHLQTVFSTNLPESLLYNFKDRLDLKKVGSKYVDLYYIVGEHFQNTLSAEIIYDMSLIANDVNGAISRYLSNSDQVVLTQSLYNKIENIMIKSKNNSVSLDYIELVDAFLLELDKYVGLTGVELSSTL